jgi:tRNA-Thr(GGU) m(6)t(6)A37 methyltransferase TsaA
VIGLDVARIGCVRDLGDGRSLLEILPAFIEGLEGLTPGDRVQVLYWMHELTRANRRALRVHRRGDTSAPFCGVFSLRSPMRPNPIGVTEAEVVEVRDRGLVVLGLDARDGSPLIDIKAVCR